MNAIIQEDFGEKMAQIQSYQGLMAAREELRSKRDEAMRVSTMCLARAEKNMRRSRR